MGPPPCAAPGCPKKGHPRNTVLSPTGAKLKCCTKACAKACAEALGGTVDVASRLAANARVAVLRCAVEGCPKRAQTRNRVLLPGGGKARLCCGTECAEALAKRLHGTVDQDRLEAVRAYAKKNVPVCLAAGCTKQASWVWKALDGKGYFCRKACVLKTPAFAVDMEHHERCLSLQRRKNALAMELGQVFYDPAKHGQPETDAFIDSRAADAGRAVVALLELLRGTPVGVLVQKANANRTKIEAAKGLMYKHLAGRKSALAAACATGDAVGIIGTFEILRTLHPMRAFAAEAATQRELMELLASNPGLFAPVGHHELMFDRVGAGGTAYPQPGYQVYAQVSIAGPESVRGFVTEFMTAQGFPLTEQLSGLSAKKHFRTSVKSATSAQLGKAREILEKAKSATRIKVVKREQERRSTGGASGARGGDVEDSESDSDSDDSCYSDGDFGNDAMGVASVDVAGGSDAPPLPPPVGGASASAPRAGTQRTLEGWLTRGARNDADPAAQGRCPPEGKRRKTASAAAEASADEKGKAKAAPRPGDPVEEIELEHALATSAADMGAGGSGWQ